MKSSAVPIDAVPASTRVNMETEALRNDVKKHLPTLEKGDAVMFELDEGESVNGARGRLQRAAKSLGANVTITGRGPLYMIPKQEPANIGPV